MRLIHLQSSTTGTALCNEMQPNDILTAEAPPHNREASKLCKLCSRLYNLDRYNERVRAQETYNNRSTRQKSHDWLVELSRFGEDDMAVVMDLMLLASTFGLIIPAKHIAKWLLKVGL